MIYSIKTFNPWFFFSSNFSFCSFCKGNVRQEENEISNTNRFIYCTNYKKIIRLFVKNKLKIKYWNHAFYDTFMTSVKELFLTWKKKMFQAIIYNLYKYFY